MELGNGSWLVVALASWGWHMTWYDAKLLLLVVVLTVLYLYLLIRSKEIYSEKIYIYIHTCRYISISSPSFFIINHIYSVRFHTSHSSSWRNWFKWKLQKRGAHVFPFCSSTVLRRPESLEREHEKLKMSKGRVKWRWNWKTPTQSQQPAQGTTTNKAK